MTVYESEMSKSNHYWDVYDPEGWEEFKGMEHETTVPKVLYEQAYIE